MEFVIAGYWLIVLILWLIERGFPVLAAEWRRNLIIPPDAE